jgi:hypothetical protein
MRLRQISTSKYLLILILAVFFLKGVFLATLYPIFGGQDEARHYSGVQYLAEPHDIGSDRLKDPRSSDNTLVEKDNFDSYNFSEEIQKTARATDTRILRGEMFNTIGFSGSYDGRNEMEIDAKRWKPYNYYEHPDVAGASSLYHRLASVIERFFSEQSILVRFYLIRIFSVLLGALAVFLAYRIAQTIGFAEKHALILAAIIAFQPKFSSYFTNINYDVLLIPMFFLFTLAGVLVLKDGLNWKNSAFLAFAITGAIFTKATGYILVVAALGLVAYLLYEKVKLRERQVRNRAYAAVALMTLAVASYIYTHFLVSTQSLGQTIGSIGDYLSRTITFGKFVMPSDTYWGTLSWVRSPVLDNTTNFLLIVELAALVGLGIYFFSKKFTSPDSLPKKKYVLFLIGMVVLLELGIRVADWHVFSGSGSMRYSLGTPGRYFLPNLSAHILLIATGLGALLVRFKKEHWFETTLLSGLILMFALNLYLIFDVIILRFYF